jgi:hypothetical protein
MDQAKTSTMTCLKRNGPVARVLISIAEFGGWLARAEPGERLKYHRGLLAIDRSKGTSSLKEPERRKLAAVADHALALADRGKLHLLQERHGNGDYSYWAVASASARSLEQVPSRFPIDQRSEHPRP